jgi:DNA helicase HerA-like ATPase/DNA-binding MarR family transcriptional regulator
MSIEKRISIDVSKEIKRLVPVLGKEKASRLETAYLLADEETRVRILEMIDALKAAVLSDKNLKNSVLIEPPSKETVSFGDIQFGTVLYGKKKLYPLFLKKENFLTHIGVFGSSGYGKTNLIHWLVSNLTMKEIPVLIFDFSKRNYRDLLSIPELKDKIRIYTVGRNISPFRFNPLKPPEGIQLSQWIKEFSEIFDHAYWMLGGGRHIILKALDAVYEGLSPKIPKLEDLKDWLEKYRSIQGSSREKNWISTAERPLESLCFRETGEVFDCEEGILPSKLLEKGTITILELDSFTTNDKTFFIEIMLQWLRDEALVSGSREKLKGIIVLEEAHHVLNREKSKRIGMETVIDLIFREVRELGLGMVYVDQHPSLISYPALGNTSTHIYMNLGLDTKYSSDILDASNMLGLDYDEEGDYLRRLPVGHAFILMRRLDFPYPFLVQFPLVELDKGSIKDEIVKEFMQDKLLDDIKKIRGMTPVEPTEQTKKTIEVRPEDIDEKCWKIIEIIGKAEGSSTSDIYGLIGISGNSFKKHADELIELGLIDYNIGKVYRQKAIFYFLTDEGRGIFESKFDEVIEKVDLDLFQIKNFLINHFSLKGWKFVEEVSNQVIFDNQGNKLFANVLLEIDDEKIKNDFENLTEKSNLYFVCGSEKIKNYIIQQTAKHSLFNKIDLTIFVSSINDLKDNKDFRKIEFQSDHSSQINTSM